MRIVLGIPVRPPVPGRWRSPLSILGSLTIVAAAFGAATGYFVRMDMPDLRGLEDYAPPEMTRILDRAGLEVASFASEKRILLDSGEIPESFRLALIASEDSRFHEHAGIDPIGGARALWNDLRARSFSQGASTLTMQLAGNMFLDRSQRTVRRKVQEAFLAMEIERRFSKQEIIRMYCNQVHFGHGLYGLEAAARYYFGKPARLLTMGESATLVGLLPRPASYSPFRNMERAVERRNLVLRRMVVEGYLAQAESKRLSAAPILLDPRDDAREPAAHFNENVRRWLQEHYGSGDLYRGGMVATTTLDPALQGFADRAVDAGLRQLDKRQGWRPDAVRRVPAGEDPRSWISPAWARRIVDDRVTDAVVLHVGAESAQLRVAEQSGTLTVESIAWTGRSRPERLLHPGDVIRVRVVGRDPDGGLRLALEQEPEVEAALVAIDPSSGEVLALVGGFDFSRSEYDRATQAKRQPGSLFKPFAYAAALSDGWTLADVLVDEPTVFLDRSKPVPYQPENFNRRYYGTITLRTALEKSANIATVKLLERIGYDTVIDTAQRLGIGSRMRPYPSLALGAFELTLLEVTSAYGALANQGLLMEPHVIKKVTDRTGRTIHLARPRVTEAVPPPVAYLMNQALSGVMRRGTGRTAGALFEQTLAGKTGTTDDYTDAWFVGYSPRLVVGVWVGYDEPRSLGESETGARAALPIWSEFMKQALAGVGDKQFPVPLGIVSVPVDSQTGKRSAPGTDCGDLVVEFFVKGTEPTEICSPALHDKLRLPYPFQRYPVDAGGALEIPGDELVRLLEQESSVAWDQRREMLESWGQTGIVRVPVSVLPDSQPTIDGMPEPKSWTGTDGRPANVIWFDG